MTFNHIYKYSQVHNTKTICLFELFQKTFFLTSFYSAQSQIHWKQLIADRSQESSKYGVKIYPFLGGFTEISGKKQPHITISRNWL